MARLRGAVFGFGRMGRHHVRSLSARPDVQLTVIDPDKGLPHPPSLDVDFAVIATPTRSHVTVAQPLLDAGIPCLVEKPLAPTAAAAAPIADHPLLGVGHIERFNPALAAVTPGAFQFLEVERIAPFDDQRGVDVDVIADLMIHDLDLALWLLGGPASDVRAVGVGVATGVLDIVNARIELPGGVAQLTASRVSRKRARTLRLVADGVYWSVDLDKGAVTRVRWGDGELSGEAIPVAPGDALAREQGAFLAAVRGEHPFPVNGTAALRTLELADAVRGALP